MTANNSISLAQFDYAVKFEEEYREAIASGVFVFRLIRGPTFALYFMHFDIQILREFVQFI